MSIDELMWEQEIAEHMRRYVAVFDESPGAADRAVHRVLAVVALAVVEVLVLTAGLAIGWYAV